MSSGTAALGTNYSMNIHPSRVADFDPWPRVDELESVRRNDNVVLIMAEELLVLALHRALTTIGIYLVLHSNKTEVTFLTGRAENCYVSEKPRWGLVDCRSKRHTKHRPSSKNYRF